MATPVLDLVSSDVAQCSGHSADTYDRYVLGLLDTADRAAIDGELEQRCAACIAGIQRSINLWLVFAGSLEQVEPAANFRGRLIRIAEMSNRVLTVPKRYRQRRPAVLLSTVVIICLILTMLLIFTFLAGRQSSRLEVTRVRTELVNLHNESAANQVKLQEESDRYKEIEAKLNHPSASPSVTQLQDELAKSRVEKVRFEAEIQSYKDIVDRDKQRMSENSTLVTALANPGVRLLTFKGTEGTSSPAYAFVIGNAKLLFVASKLPAISDQHQYQLWLIRKSDRSPVSLGTFSVKKDVPEVLAYDEDKDTIADLAGLIVTEEGLEGSQEPSASRVLETSGMAVTSPVVVPTVPVTPPQEQEH